ncbi:protein Dr1-like protein isoform X1 [Senna tora]|uniref:Protein Dr1-like protein isoform X1 n=1 Tax=Senna tora TaxID=362788 RepID=A0A834W234_9FABA|nr:protein Dr1-like protein isoform X1 [Senna tora]
MLSYPVKPSCPSLINPYINDVLPPSAPDLTATRIFNRLTRHPSLHTLTDSGKTMDPMDIIGKSKEDASLPKELDVFPTWLDFVFLILFFFLDKVSQIVLFRIEFINLVSSESNEVCNREDKRTIAPEHVLKALQVLGFGEYIEEVYAAYEQHKIETMWNRNLYYQTCVRLRVTVLRRHLQPGGRFPKEGPKPVKVGLPSRTFLWVFADSLRSGKWSNGAEMTEEEALVEQQRMFAEARARMNGGAIAPKQPDADQTLES